MICYILNDYQIGHNMTDITMIQHVPHLAQQASSAADLLSVTKANHDHAWRMIKTILYPFQGVLHLVLQVVGLCIMTMALCRTHNHGLNYRQQSSLSTSLHLLGGFMCFSYANVIQAMSNTFFQYKTNGIANYGVMEYAHTIAKDPNISSMHEAKLVTYALLMLVGLFSFGRGFVLLIKAGEGQGGGESVVTKSMMHIFAGVVAVNMPAVLHVVQTMSGNYY